MLHVKDSFMTLSFIVMMKIIREIKVPIGFGNLLVMLFLDFSIVLSDYSCGGCIGTLVHLYSVMFSH